MIPHGASRGREALRLLSFLIFLCAVTFTHAQNINPTKINIGGNVYGGGNEGDTGGNTTVTLREGAIGNVFGGARMANVEGHTFVNVDGENASGDIFIVNIYGGNDIAGTIGGTISPDDTQTDKVPAELTEVLRGTETKENFPEKNAINNTWTTYIRTSRSSQIVNNDTIEDRAIVVGRIFGGGNGDYDNYKPGNTCKDENGDDHVCTEYEIRDRVTHELIAHNTTGFTRPDLPKTYLELKGGELCHVYGGGNNATVTQNTTLCINNESDHLAKAAEIVAQRYSQEPGTTVTTQEMLQYFSRMTELNTFQSQLDRYDYTFARIFGGNNKRDMSIMPTWNIQRGRIRDIYSGGNEGNMTSEHGLLLEIAPLAKFEPNKNLFISNVYGGCRRADVHPTNSQGRIPDNIQLPSTSEYSTYRFPPGFSARTIVRGGYIVNVYGGNDISGHVFGGDAVGIYSTIYGDLYGGGNGSYAYTDNADLGAISTFQDFYYNPDTIRAKERLYGDESFEFTSDDPSNRSVEALNIFKPNAEQISILLRGKDKDHPTVIKGGVFLGGNSATLKRKDGLAEGEDPTVELKIGSHVIADKVFLGNNGENMVDTNLLKLFAAQVDASGTIVESGGYDYSQMNLKTGSIFAKYMDGCAMQLKPSVIFEQAPRDPYTYVPHSSYFGSFYCGGNRGSMVWPGTNTINFNKEVIIFDKFVGGCNDANIQETNYNAKYFGGMIGSKAEQQPHGMENPDGSIKDCLVLNFSGLKIRPMRWVDDDDPSQGLEWNTFDDRTGIDCDAPAISGNTASTADDIHRRLRGGNIYGGCYESGHMNGNVVINIIDDIHDLAGDFRVFDDVEKQSDILYENTSYTIKERHSGVILDEQGMDPLGLALNVFGGGYGPDSEVWGSATVNLRAGHTFQIFGGGQQGPIGKSREDENETHLPTDYEFNGKHYQYDARYSTYVNMEDDDHVPANATADNFPEIQFIYGGSFEAPIMGNTHVYLGNGRIFNSFAGSCNADILGHTETYVGKSINRDGTSTDGTFISSFPYVIDHIYGGNDLGGRILGEIRAKEKPTAVDAQQALADCDFTAHVGGAVNDGGNGQDLTKVYQYNASTNPNPMVLRASAYVEYSQGRVVNIFGGAYGDYNYKDVKYREYCDEYGRNKGSFSKPRLGNAFVNIKPISSNNALNTVAQIYGAGQGQHYAVDRDSMQQRSYILIDIPQTMTQFENTAIFGAGAFGGVGMAIDSAMVTALPDTASAVIDLFRGQIKNVYGGSYNEGVTRRTVVNIPVGSTITANNIFGGAYGEDNRYPCDVYESNVNYNASTEITGGIYGGNNNARRTIYANVNVNATIWSNKKNGYQGYVYGAGKGADTWAEYTNVTIGNGGLVYKVFGGGDAGLVLNEKSVNEKKRLAEAETDSKKKGLDLKIGGDYHNCGLRANHLPFSEMALDIEAKKTRDFYNKKERYNTNVHILRGADVTGYGYGGGYGATATVSGTTYIDLLGGTVDRDIYGGGQGGDVRDLYGLKTFKAITNAYVKGGTVRNAYGGGYLGPVGYHSGNVLSSTTGDVLASSNVVVGVLPEKVETDPSGTDADYQFYHGVPAIKRNVYGSGEGGSIYGSAHLTVNNGYVGYRYTSSATDKVATPKFDERYVEEVDDPGLGESASHNAIKDAGNAFGGGYIANSYVDTTYVSMYGGHLRGSIFGGGEIGPVGRGSRKDQPNPETDKPTIQMGGSTHVYLYNGHVHRNVFGGGRGYDSWGGDGTKFMSQAQIDASDFYTKGFIFGNTDVNIRGGIVGTTEGVGSGLDGDGNVFGGGDVGYVYSATGSPVGTNPNNIQKESNDDNENGLPVDGGGFYYKNGNISNGMTVDCSVDVAPYCQVLQGQSLTLPKLQTDADGNFVRETSGDNKGYPVKVAGQTVTFSEYEYVPVEYLDLLSKATSDWNKIDYESGIVIHNAVFAGGNVSVGSDQVFVNSNTVFGNATAALRDVYHRDLITVGTEHIGGLYGDGNLTFVDGFRELNISNYGTDFYGLEDKITLEQYRQKSDRERAYFQLEYECQHEFTINENTPNERKFTVGQKISESDYKELFQGTENTQYDNEYWWQKAGFCSLYAGRLLNTVQRADFVGVWGSRMVLQGARDRVPEKADYTTYTINRVGEVSLNCSKTQCSDDTAEEDMLHGNYFGIYNIVNYLGNLTSDVTFNDVRVTDTKDDIGTGTKITVDGKPYGTATYWDWKKNQAKEQNRNNGTSKNMVALASGVYLEIINESSETSGNTDWGYITGVVQLDLINVMTGLGGGYVYAKNEHGQATHHTTWNKVTMSPYNQFAVTYKRYTYAPVTATDEVETSGNFIHNTKRIIDDCYPFANSFYGDEKVDAHYWYIKGSVYVYDQYISAFTGSATAYSKNISLPLTITANAHGKLTMTEVQPNRYAYYGDVSDSNSANWTRLGLGENENFVANNITYHLNDPITYWDYEMLSDEDKKKFVSETYTVIDSCMINGTLYPKGYTMLKAEYDTFTGTPEVKIKDIDTGSFIVDPNDIKDFNYMVRLSNNLGHDTGYVLTYKVDNPMVWDQYYTKTDNSGKMNTKNYTDAHEPTGYIEGPTYRLTDTTPGVFGQKKYEVGSIIDESIQSTYTEIPASYRNALTNQATFETAYVVKQELVVNDNNGDEHHIYPGVAIAKSDYSNNWSSISSKVAPALVITSTLEVTPQKILYSGDLYSEDQLKAFIKEAKGYTNDSDVDTYFHNNSSYYADAFYCSTAGSYGGDLYSPSVAYPAIDAWSSMSEADKAHFAFNYDALDLLIDPTYANIMTRYDGSNNPKIYSPVMPIDYQAKLTGATSITYTKPNGTTTVTITDTEELSREEFEAIPNERYHYAPITVTKPDSTYYVVNTAFIRGDMPYSVGQGISEKLYNSLSSEQKLKVDDLHFNAIATEATKESPVTFYYCRDSYTVNENGEGVPVTDVFDGEVVITSGNPVPVGFIINSNNFKNLPNKTVDDENEKQLFTIYGRAPIETSTLIVSRESDILDLSKEKTITVMFTYEYEESDEAGVHITPITERHIVNIHLEFKSGVPEIGQLSKPNTVLPGTTAGLKVPNITPGAYEVLGSGWELFTNQPDATSHKNGQPYQNNDTKMYWYQDGYYVAYYAKTYLGKTYSNSVPFSVANYHHLDDVMKDKENHMFIDHKDAHRQRDPKIYIDSRSCASDENKNELDLLKDFFDLTQQPKQFNVDEESVPIANSGALSGHHGVNTEYIGSSKNLQFYLRSDMVPKAYSETDGGWTPIGTYSDDGDDTNDHCFEGTLHGDGYTISGLTNSLFENLCGEVYNLGVTGSFQGAGIVETGTGYVENCWVMSSANTVNDVKAVFGNPSDAAHPTSQQVVNCYYPETNAYSETTNAHGNARKMPLSAFYNGEVTYDLNGFYLNKRYFDQELSETGNKAYTFWRANGDGSLPTTPETKYYTTGYAIYPLTATTKDKTYGYVEDRYADGDYIYAGGSIPENKDIRFNTTNSKYYPIWPDDYLFFGQRLTYDYVDGRPHQNTPSHINKTNTRLTSTPTEVNRVYRAPAYFQSKVMGVAHYNPYAVFAQHKNGDETRLAYKNMTAIDFTGANGDVTDYPTITSADYKQGLCASASPTGEPLFFPPLLDNDGLVALRNFGLTKNWLVYTPDAIAGDENAADSKTNDVVLDYLKDPVYTEGNATGSGYVVAKAAYRTVAPKDIQDIHGHAVVKKGTDTYTALGNHFLVDKQDFNAPVSYTFAAGQRMWYQRKPDNYVDRTKGWEGISIPFAAEVVTTDVKGEITHFYSGSRNSFNDTHTKRGHEYWLREFDGKVKVSTDPDPEVYHGNFVYPTSAPSTIPAELVNKEYTNTFLWDYYYQLTQESTISPRQDVHTDTYQQQYYNEPYTYENYAYSTAARPYIIGFPGSTYYEFDLSGTFDAEGTKERITKLRQQTITFASFVSSAAKPVTIAVSDDECSTDATKGAAVTHDGYSFMPNYLTKELSGENYQLKSDGSAYEVVTSTKADPNDPSSADIWPNAVPFRPHFYKPSAPVKGDKPGVKYITFSNVNSQLGNDEEHDISDGLDGTLIVKGKYRRILVTSAYNSDTTVHIYNAAGALIRTFTLAPGETVETHVAAGVYIVNKTKVSIK